MENSTSLEEITQRLQRDVNCLSDDNRTTRRRALERLRKESLGHTPVYAPEVLQGLLDFLLKPLLRVFSDSVEKCRELAVGLVADFAPAVEDITAFLPLVLPVAVARLGTPEITEPSEELRLMLVTLLTSLVQLCRSKMAPYLGDMVAILQRTIIDPYPEVKKESCTCSSKLAEAIPATFHQQSESLSKPLLQSLAHQHSRVRVACLKALGTTIHFGSATPIDKALPALAQRACDSTPSVRSCLVDVVGEWLLDLPDRYSYHHKLIPLLLTSMTDELPEIRHKAHNLWEKVGAKYESENEDDLKDQLDFTKPVEAAPGLEFPRPRLGCRVLVYRTFSKILPAILRDIVDWTINSRIKEILSLHQSRHNLPKWAQSSQLLHTLLYHLEDHSTHNIQAILNGLYRACHDDEISVQEQAVKCSEVIGFYVSPEVWCRLVLPAVRTSAGCRVGATGSGGKEMSTVAVGPVQCTGCLTVLAGLVRGAKIEDVRPHLQAITECLAEPEVSQSAHAPLLQQLLACVTAATRASGDTCRQHSLGLFSVLLRVAAAKNIEQLKPEVASALSLLCSTQGMEDIMELYQAHAQDIVSGLKAGYTSWTVHSPDCALFASLLSGAGPVIGQLLDDVIPILTSCLSPESDPEMRLHFITLLIRLLLDAPSTVNSQKQFSLFALRVVSDIIIPNLVWRAGRTSAAIRTATMTSLQALLQGKLLAQDQLNQLLPDLLPKVVSSVDDDNQSTRLVSCKVLQLLLVERPPALDTLQAGDSFDSVDKLHSLYGDLLKRLDDSSDEVRIATTRTLSTYANAFPVDYDRDLYKAHIEAFYKGLLIHLDDPSSDIQAAVLLVLQQAARLNSAILRQQVEAVKHKHRTPRYCDELLTFLEQL